MNEQTWNPFDADMTEQVDVKVQAAASQSNFGRLSVATRFLHYDNNVKQIEEVTAADFRAHANEPKGYWMEHQFTVDPSEFNPTATFIFVRKVSQVASEQIKDANGGKTGKYTKSDWVKTVEPSIVAVFGSVKSLGQALQSKAGVYVEVESVAQRADEHYNKLKFVRQFASVTECANAWRAKYGGASNGNTPKFSAEQIEAAQIAINTFTGKNGTNLEKVKGNLAGNEVTAKCNLDELIEAAKA